MRMSIDDGGSGGLVSECVRSIRDDCEHRSFCGVCVCCVCGCGVAGV